MSKPTPGSRTTALEQTFAELSREREALREDWGALQERLGLASPPPSAALSALIERLPDAERRALQRFQAETEALVADLSARPAPRLPPLAHRFLRA